MVRVFLVLVVLCALLVPSAGLARDKPPGTLTIDSNPSRALVRVDGLKIGRTPIRNHSLPAGAHQIELSNEVLGAKRLLRIVVNAGKNTKLTVDLSR